MEIKLKRFMSHLTIILVVAVLFGCKQESSLPNPSQQELLPAPTGVTVKTHADKLNTVTVTWQTGDEVAEYYWIYYSTTNDTASLTTPQKREYRSSLWKGTGTCDIVLDKSGTYYFWVRAANGYSTEAGASGFSTVASYQFTFKELPAPTGVTVAAHADKLNTVTVAWQTGDEVAKYYWIYYSTTNDTASLTTPQEREYRSSLWKGTGTCDIVLDNSGTYYFWVRAASDYDTEAGASGFSTVASYQFTFKELPAPTGVTVAAHADKLNTVTVTWQTGDEVAEYYWIYYSTTNDTASLTTPQKREYRSSLWNGTGTCDIVLDKSGTYYFWVRAANGYSTESSASTFGAATSYAFTSQPLTVPTNVKAEKCESASYPGIKLSWDTTKAPYYHIYWAESNDSSTAKKLASAATNSDTIYENVYDLKKGTTYYFWVKSANGFSPADSDSDFSSVASFTYN